MQVNFNLLIPCLVLTKVGFLVAEAHSLSLMGVPLFAATQVSQNMQPCLLTSAACCILAACSSCAATDLGSAC